MDKPASPVAPEQVVAKIDLAALARKHGIVCGLAGSGRDVLCFATELQSLLAASPEAAPAAMEGSPERVYWHNPQNGQVWSETDVRFHGKDTTNWTRIVLPAATPAAPSAAGDTYSDPACQRAQMLNRQWDAGFEAGAEAALAQPVPVQAGAQQAVVAGDIPPPSQTERGLTNAERRLLQFLFANMTDLSDKDWRDHGFRLATFDSLDRKLEGMHTPASRPLAAPTQAGAGNAKGGA